MPAQASDIEVDGVTFAIYFQGFDAPLRVRTSSGSAVEFLPLRFPDYLSALGRSIYPDAGGLKLDSGRLATEVLLHNNIPENLHHELGSVALWWAIGGEHEPVEIKNDEVVLGDYEFRLRSWTAKERMQALVHCISEQTSDGMAFDFIQYIELMIRASVVRIKPSIKIEALDSATTSKLLEAVTILNVAESLSDEIEAWGSMPGLQHMLHSTLRLCKVLGWGPSQIWSLPAADIDRLIAMIEMLNSTHVNPASHSSCFTSDPNAVLINIKDDE